MQNYITIRNPQFASPEICQNAHKVTRVVFLFVLLPTAKIPALFFYSQYVK